VYTRTRSGENQMGGMKTASVKKRGREQLRRNRTWERVSRGWSPGPPLPFPNPHTELENTLDPWSKGKCHVVGGERKVWQWHLATLR
jgi:hypothetical protein